MMFYPMFYFDPTYVLILIGVIISMAASAKLNSTYQRYSAVRSMCGMTGADAAKRLLANQGIYDVTVRRVPGNLTDHYDPGAQVVRLSDSVYAGDSIASLGVAAHECGHAVQHARHYSPLMLRNAIIPITNIGSKLALPLILIGLFTSGALINLGLLLFSLAAVFQLITLPVEFNASSRALATLENTGYLAPDELGGARAVLRAAALTYVAALIVALAQLLRLVLLFGNRRRD